MARNQNRYILMDQFQGRPHVILPSLNQVALLLVRHRKAFGNAPAIYCSKVGEMRVYSSGHCEEMERVTDKVFGLVERIRTKYNLKFSQPLDLENPWRAEDDPLWPEVKKMRI